jgi:hypothetical protein
MLMQKQKKITVKEIKEIDPKADVYELSPYSRYMIMVKKSSLLDSSGKDTSMEKAKVIMNLMTQLQIPCAVLIGVSDDVKFLELN